MNANDTLTKPERIIGALSPSVVLTLPFEPGTTPRSQVEAILRDALSRSVRQLMDNYPRDTVLPVINRLEDLASNLNYATLKRSVALFASAESQKILYLDEPVEEQILIDNGFRIRDLSIPHTGQVQYYVLLLSGRLSKLYLGDNHHIQLVNNHELQDMGKCSREEHEAGTCTKPCTRKERLLDKFLYQIDEGLSAALDGHPLPVLVLASAPVAEHFGRITCNDHNISVYIHKHCVDTTEEGILDILQPYLTDWPRVRQDMALKHARIAEEAGKLDYGIEAVSKAIRSGNSRLLIIERRFDVDTKTPVKEFFIHDQIDALIEKVMERGGQVEWVDKGQLSNHEHIALVRYY